MTGGFLGPVRLERDVRGSLSVACLVAKTSAPGANDVLTSVAGFKAFEAMLAGAVTPGSGDAFTEMVAVAWSTTANDHVGVAALLATAVAEFDGAPTTPPVTIPNARVLRVFEDVFSVLWDGQTTIKTIGVRAIGATPGQVNVAVNIIE